LSKRRTRRPLLLEAIGESGWLERLGRSLIGRARDVVVGFGDDAACVTLPPGSRGLLLVTTDLLIEGTHFTWRTATPATLGEKAVAVNVSDIAAMGGRPTAMVVGLGAPADFEVARLEVVFRAMQKACRRWGIVLVGGDTVRSERFVLAPTLLGEFDGPADRLPLRSRLKERQFLYVTGTVGDAAAGMELLLARKGATALRIAEPYRRRLIERHRRPQPRLAEGQLLAGHFDDLPMIDLSDDLRKSVGLMSQAGGVGVAVQLDRLPISTALWRFCQATGRDAVEMALCGGEDYELLFATAAELAVVRGLFRRNGIKTPVEMIGRVEGRAVRWLDKSGRAIDFRGRPFEHFSH